MLADTMTRIAAAIVRFFIASVMFAASALAIFGIAWLCAVALAVIAGVAA